MKTQIEMLFTGEMLRNKGIEQAIENANARSTGWANEAYQFLLDYIKDHKEFMTEDVRNASAGIVPDPPSKRAWGGIVVRAAKNKLIEKRGFKAVQNPNAHCTPATLWAVATVRQVWKKY
jgi:hypothetical protein